jgi:hypothetical protein
MPTPTYEPLATVTLAATSTSVTLSNIPATSRDLVLTFSGINSDPANLLVRFNGNSGGSAYAFVVYGATTSIYNDSGSGSGINQAGAGLTSGYSVWQIMDYATTDKQKTVLARTGVGSTYVAYSAERFGLTEAITSITLVPVPGTLQIGCKINLYGIVS